VKDKVIGFIGRWLAGGLIREIADGRRGARLQSWYWAAVGRKTMTGWVLALLLGATIAVNPQLGKEIMPYVGTVSGLLIGWGFLDKQWRESQPPEWVGEGLHTLLSLGPALSAIAALLVSHLSPEWASRVDLGAAAIGGATAWLAARFARPPLGPEFEVSDATLRRLRQGNV
jgi:hypothetical protein